MIRSLLVCSLTLVLTATSASAGLDLAWNACNTNGGQLAEVFDCTGGTPSILHGSWQVAVSQDSVVAMDGVMDLVLQSTQMPSFWHFESCNQGYDFSRIRPGTGCTGSFAIWTPVGSDQGVSFSPPGSPNVPPGANRGRWFFSIFRPNSNPTNVPAARNNFGFAFTFLMTSAMENGGSCEGCTAGATITWSSAMLANVRSSNTGSYSIQGPGLTNNCVWINGSSLPCFIGDTPVRSRTWGQIKSFYH